MSALFRYCVAVFYCLIAAIITDASAATPLKVVRSEASSPASGNIREIRITNGEPVNAGEFPFLTAVLSGRKADVQIGTELTSGYFVGGFEPVHFFGPVIECGLSTQPCVGASGKVCSIALDFPTAEIQTVSPAQQLKNCRLGGGTAAIFWNATGVDSADLWSNNPSIPAVYLLGSDSKQRWLNALMADAEINVNVIPDVADEILCGGIYIGERWVLTAAHCVTDKSGSEHRTVEPYELLVNVGAHDLFSEKKSVQRVAEIVTNNYHTIGPWGVNDYALLRIEAPPQYGEPVALITSDELNSLAAVAAPAHVVGWGSTKVREPLEPQDLNVLTTSNVPRSASLMLHTVHSCSVLWRDFFLLNNLDAAGLSINRNHICASNLEFQRDTCQGDSGGPLLVSSEGELKLAGITNFGLGCGSSNSVPSVYASVPAFSDWISNVTGLNKFDTVIPTADGLYQARALTSAEGSGSGTFQLSGVATILGLLVFRRRRRRHTHGC